MRIAAVLFMGGTLAAAAAEAQTYRGICEPSGGAFIGKTLFAVASDESNAIRIYRRGSPDIVNSVDAAPFTGYDKSDIEGAAASHGIVYWTASQSDNRDGKDTKRKVLFKTRIVEQDGSTTLEPTGIVREDLKSSLVALGHTSGKAINIEGLAATPDGGLLFGFRNLVGGEAAVVKLVNPDAVLASARTLPVFGPTAWLDLGGRGIRSLDRIDDRYLIVAGRPDDETPIGYRLYWWSGQPGDRPEPWKEQPDLAGMDPEVALSVPGTSTIQIISDDGDRCPKVKLEDRPSDDRGFQSLDVTP